MALFKFRLQSLLNYRQNRRDQCRMLLAAVLAEDQKMIDQKAEFQQNRLETLEEIKRGGNQGAVDVDGISARRFHSTQLTIYMMGIDQQRTFIARQIELCRQALIQADQDVKVLEQLKEKQQTEFQALQNKKEDRQREESWSAIHR
ncbi:hypothetical protein MNBD_PLANCTO02-2797 [hydrothermal vent metagenome]|uniref:Flagellar FliJ protein n=1 Tax=hydrothermal vent metagenome TaxID=652676 RepID=A0A3B1DSK6_9ZZZZ